MATPTPQDVTPYLDQPQSTVNEALSTAGVNLQLDYASQDWVGAEPDLTKSSYNLNFTSPGNGIVGSKLNAKGSYSEGASGSSFSSSISLVGSEGDSLTESASGKSSSTSQSESFAISGSYSLKSTLGTVDKSDDITLSFKSTASGSSKSDADGNPLSASLAASSAYSFSGNGLTETSTLSASSNESATGLSAKINGSFAVKEMIIDDILGNNTIAASGSTAYSTSSKTDNNGNETSSGSHSGTYTYKDNFENLKMTGTGSESAKSNYDAGTNNSAYGGSLSITDTYTGDSTTKSDDTSFSYQRNYTENYTEGLDSGGYSEAYTNKLSYSSSEYSLSINAKSTYNSDGVSETGVHDVSAFTYTDKSDSSNLFTINFSGTDTYLTDVDGNGLETLDVKKLTIIDGAISITAGKISTDDADVISLISGNIGGSIDSASMVSSDTTEMLSFDPTSSPSDNIAGYIAGDSIHGLTTTFAGNVDFASMTDNLRSLEYSAALLSGNDTITVVAKANGDGAGFELNGFAGNDTISGGTGDDILTGGAGADILTGGAGADKFVFSMDDYASGTINTDTIKDFSVSQGDTLDMGDLGTSGLHYYSTFQAGLDSGNDLFYAGDKGAVYFDINNNGNGSATDFAKIINFSSKPAFTSDVYENLV